MKIALPLVLATLSIACSSEPWQPPASRWNPSWMDPVAAPAAWEEIRISGSGTSIGSLADLPALRSPHFVIGNGTGSGEGEIEISDLWPSQEGIPRIEIVLIGDLSREIPPMLQAHGLLCLLRYLTARCGISDEQILFDADVRGIDQDIFWNLLEGSRTEPG